MLKLHNNQEILDLKKDKSLLSDNLSLMSLVRALFFPTKGSISSTVPIFETVLNMSFSCLVCIIFFVCILPKNSLCLKTFWV